MYKILTEEQLEIVRRELPDARIHDRGNGNYKIRGVPEEKVDNLFKCDIIKEVTNIFKETETMEVKVMAEPEKIVGRKVGGFSGLMMQAAGELEADMDIIKNDMLEKSKKLEAAMEATRVKLEADAKQKLENLGKVVDEKSKMQDAKIEAAIKDLNQSFANYKTVTDAKIERIDNNVKNIDAKLLKIGNVLKP